MTPYTDKTTIENYLLQSIDSSFDDQISAWILAMSRYIDKKCNRIIFDDTESTVLYDGDDTNLLHIQDCNSISEVLLNNVDITSSIFEYPSNKQYTSRIVVDPNGLIGKFTQGFQNVSVTGIQAMHSELPEDIKLACTILVAGIINNSILGNKAGSTERIGNYLVTYRTPSQQQDFASIQSILSTYTRIAL